MTIFSNLFAKQEDTFSDFNWIPLTDISQLEEIVKASNTKSQAIFKHSTRCGISSMVIKQFEQKEEANTANIDFYYLDLLRFRDISNAISTTFNVEHQSPQLLVIKEGKAIAHNSHHGIIDLKLA